MRNRPLGRTGISVSEYGIGTWALGGGFYGIVDDAESIRTIHRAEQLGINFIDTAPLYGIRDNKDGRAETVIGEALAQDARRDRWVIASKYGRHLTGKQPLWQNLYNDWSGKQAEKSVEESLKRLQTDHLDVLFAHSPPAAEWDPSDAINGMNKLKKQGKIRAVGFSFWQTVADTIDQVAPFMRTKELDVVQVIFSLLNREPIDILFPITQETNTAVVAREALANGFLTDSFTADTVFDKEDFKANMKREDVQARLDKANKLKFLVGRPGIRSLPEAALNYTLSFKEVSCVIPGAKTVKEIEQCVSAAGAPPFDPDTLAQIDRVQKEFA
jgi:aryl-alcohol dehydrogenase-like predicted oxidoreductase